VQAVYLQLGATVRRLRKERGWSQDVLADRSGLHRAHLGEIERGETNVTLQTLKTLADTFHVRLTDFATARPGAGRRRTRAVGAVAARTRSRHRRDSTSYSLASHAAAKCASTGGSEVSTSIPRMFASSSRITVGCWSEQSLAWRRRRGRR